MRMEQLKYLIHIAKTGCISKSAEELFITQQGLSKSIRNMEKELDIQLLVRKKNGTELTMAGKRIVEKAKEITDSWDAMVYKISEDSTLRKEENICSIHSTPRTCATLMPIIVKKYFENYPHMGIKIIENELEDFMTSLDFSSPEIFVFNAPDFLFNSYLKERSDITFKILREDKIKVVVPENSKLSSHEYIKVEELENVPIAFLGGDERLLNHISNRKVNNMKAILHTTNFELFREVLKRSDAVGLCSGVFEEWIKSSKSRIIPLQNAVVIVSAYVVNEYVSTNPIAIEVMNMIQEQFKLAQP